MIEAEKTKYSSYAAFRRINADFNLEGENQANPVAAQNRWMKDMKQFLEDFPKSDEEPEVLFQLASTNEFSGEEAEARTYYGRLVSGFPETLPGKKAAGALRRLDSVGKPLAIRGKTSDGPTIDSAQLKGKTVLIAFWATSVKAWKQDMPEIAKIYDKLKPKGFDVVSVCLDNDAASLAAFLKDNPLPWPTIFEPGGLESRLGVEFGIVALPTMILVDADGKVINRAMRNAADLDIQLEKALAGKARRRGGAAGELREPAAAGVGNCLQPALWKSLPDVREGEAPSEPGYRARPSGPGDDPPGRVHTRARAEPRPPGRVFNRAIPAVNETAPNRS